MKRNSILVLGLGMLVSFGLLAPGCGDDGKKGGTGTDGSIDGKKDTGSAKGGTTGTGGATGKGGTTGSGGATGAGGATGVGGATGTGGATTDGGPLTGPEPSLDGGPVRLDTNPPVDTKGTDAIDAPIPNPDGEADGPGVDGAKLDGTVILQHASGLDAGVDSTPGSVDAALDSGADAAPASIDLGVDGESVDADVDSGIDA
jgi:hypothetical protein